MNSIRQYSSPSPEQTPISSRNSSAIWEWLKDVEQSNKIEQLNEVVQSNPSNLPPSSPKNSETPKKVFFSVRTSFQKSQKPLKPKSISQPSSPNKERLNTPLPNIQSYGSLYS